MRRYVIATYGDNDELHEKALKAAVEAIEAVNHTPAYRAWIEKVEYEVTPPAPSGEVHITAVDSLSDVMARASQRVGRMASRGRI